MGTEDAYTPAECGRRAKSRLRLRVAIRVVTLHEQGPGLLENVSATGARIATRLELRKGMSCLVQLPGTELLVDVAWSIRDRCGLIFEQPLSQAQILMLRRIDETPRPGEREARLAWARNFVDGTNSHLN